MKHLEFLNVDCSCEQPGTADYPKLLILFDNIRSLRELLKYYTIMKMFVIRLMVIYLLIVSN